MDARTITSIWCCTVQTIIEEEDAEESEGMLNAVSVLNEVTPQDMTEERLYPQNSMSAHYSWGKIKLIAHH